MIQAILNGNQGILATAIISSLTAALMFYFLGRRRGGKSGPLWASVGAASAVVVTATLYPIALGAPASATCVIERDVISGTFTTQGLMNVFLFAPLAALATWATRRPVPIALGCVSLSVVIEVTQALTPGIGRACDSADLWANGLGVALGAGLSTAVLRRRYTRDAGGAPIIISRRQIRRSLVGFAAGIAAISLTASFTITFVMAEVAWANNATDEQRELAREVVAEFFGGQAQVRDVQYMPAPPGRPSLVSANTDRGVLDIELLSREVVSGVLQPISAALDPGTAPLADEAALRISTEFVRDHFPWALTGRTQLTATGPQEASKLVSWRSHKGGVLMPMRMDVVVGPDQSIISFAARHTPDPPSLPSPRLDRQQAQAIVIRDFPGKKVELTDLLARRDSAGNWRPYWIVSIGSVGTSTTTPWDGVPQDGAPQAGAGRDGTPSQILFLDAVTGAVGPANPEAWESD
ncbi:VanZ family protein [Streptomyces sp. NPDC090021]|uniref:VanZ family protein n=1 Tax=Streptomyces sp. NPDC090021 TaxID=3365919 RepID=UPI0037FFC4F9